MYTFSCFCLYVHPPLQHPSKPLELQRVLNFQLCGISSSLWCLFESRQLRLPLYNFFGGICIVVPASVLNAVLISHYIISSSSPSTGDANTDFTKKERGHKMRCAWAIQTIHKFCFSSIMKNHHENHTAT